MKYWKKIVCLLLSAAILFADARPAQAALTNDIRHIGESAGGKKQLKIEGISLLIHELDAYDGDVVGAAYNNSMGNYIMIDHGSGLYTIYMHCSALYVSKGQTVTKGPDNSTD